MLRFDHQNSEICPAHDRKPAQNKRSVVINESVFQTVQGTSPEVLLFFFPRGGNQASQEEALVMEETE